MFTFTENELVTMFTCVEKGIQLCDIGLEDNTIPEDIKSSIRNVKSRRVALKKKILSYMKSLKTS